LSAEDENAINLIENLIARIQNLDKSHAQTAEHAQWLMETLSILEDIFGDKSRTYLSFVNLTWRPSGGYWVRGPDIESQIEYQRKQAYIDDLNIAEGILKAGIQLIKRKGVMNVYEGKDTPKESSEIIKIISLIENKLRKVIRDPPKNEIEVQDKIESLFIGAGLDGQYTREIEHMPYSSKSYIPDFLFEKIKTVVEVKLCKTADKEKDIISEINDDIIAYKTRYPNLIFVVYDLGIIRDQDKFKNDIMNNEQVQVIIVKQ
jgi:REase_DpnII-MboI